MTPLIAMGLGVVGFWWRVGWAVVVRSGRQGLTQCPSA